MIDCFVPGCPNFIIFLPSPHTFQPEPSWDSVKLPKLRIYTDIQLVLQGKPEAFFLTFQSLSKKKGKNPKPKTSQTTNPKQQQTQNKETSIKPHQNKTNPEKIKRPNKPKGKKKTMAIYTPMAYYSVV